MLRLLSNNSLCSRGRCSDCAIVMTLFCGWQVNNWVCILGSLCYLNLHPLPHLCELLDLIHNTFWIDMKLVLCPNGSRVSLAVYYRAWALNMTSVLADHMLWQMVGCWCMFMSRIMGNYYTLQPVEFFRVYFLKWRVFGKYNSPQYTLLCTLLFQSTLRADLGIGNDVN